MREATSVKYRQSNVVTRCVRNHKNSETEEGYLNKNLVGKVQGRKERKN